MADQTKAQERKDEREAAQTAERERIERESAAEIERSRAERQAKATPAKEDKNSSAARLRAFEDEVFGKRAVRINGQIERGVGSPYADMTDERKARYAALEALVVAEQRLNDATAAVGAAEAERVAAEERLAQCDKTVQEAAADAEKDKAEGEKPAALDKSETEKTHKDKADAPGA